MDACEEVACGLFVARCDGSELLDDVEEAFDEVALAIECEVAVALLLAVRSRRYHSLDLAHFKALYEAIGVVAFIGDERLRIDLLGERFGLRDVVDLTAGEAHGERIAERIDDGVDFRRQPAARAADGLVAPFLCAPALC